MSEDVLLLKQERCSNMLILRLNKQRSREIKPHNELIEELGLESRGLDFYFSFLPPKFGQEAKD